MDKKEKGIFIGLSALIGIGIGFMAFKSFKIINIGHIEKLTLVDRNDGDVHKD